MTDARADDDDGQTRAQQERRLADIDAELIRISGALMVTGNMFPNLAIRQRRTDLRAEGRRISDELGLPPDARYEEPVDGVSSFWILAATIAGIAAVIAVAASVVNALPPK